MVQFELSKDSCNNIIHITDAIKGEKYYCLNEDCKSEFIVKKGDINAHHFAHKTSNFDHQGETIEHYNAKWQIFAILNSNKAKLGYICPVCKKKHFIHLSEWYDHIHIEKPFFGKKYRPDIALTKNNKLNAVIEIIYKHDLDFNAEKLLFKNQIPCFKYLISQNASIELTKLYRNSLTDNTNDIILFDLNSDTSLNFDTTNCPNDMGRSYDCNRDLQPRNEFPAFDMGVGYNCNLYLNPKEYMGRFYNCNHNLQPNFYKIEKYNCNSNLQPLRPFDKFKHPEFEHLDCCVEPYLKWDKNYNNWVCWCDQGYYFHDNEYHKLLDKLKETDTYDGVVCPHCEATNKKLDFEESHRHCYVCKAKLYRSALPIVIIPS